MLLLLAIRYLNMWKALSLFNLVALFYLVSFIRATGAFSSLCVCICMFIFLSRCYMIRFPDHECVWIVSWISNYSLIKLWKECLGKESVTDPVMFNSHWQWKLINRYFVLAIGMLLFINLETSLLSNYDIEVLGFTLFLNFLFIFIFYFGGKKS